MNIYFTNRTPWSDEDEQEYEKIGLLLKQQYLMVLFSNAASVEHVADLSLTDQAIESLYLFADFP